MIHHDLTLGKQPSAPIRIGIVGATPERGWAAMAHIPAIRTVPSLTSRRWPLGTNDLRVSQPKLSVRHSGSTTPPR